MKCGEFVSNLKPRNGEVKTFAYNHVKNIHQTLLLCDCRYNFTNIGKQYQLTYHITVRANFA